MENKKMNEGLAPDSGEYDEIYVGDESPDEAYTLTAR